MCERLIYDDTITNLTNMDLIDKTSHTTRTISQNRLKMSKTTRLNTVQRKTIPVTANTILGKPESGFSAALSQIPSALIANVKSSSGVQLQLLTTNAGRSGRQWGSLFLVLVGRAVISVKRVNRHESSLFLNAEY